MKNSALVSRHGFGEGLLGVGMAAALAVGLLFVIPRVLSAPGGGTTTSTAAVGVSLSNTPVFAVVDTTPNVLMVLDNSNSMDEAASGAAVGSDSAESKSRIARGVMKSLISTYGTQMNVGLMGYKQYTSGDDSPKSYYIANAPYDASYDPRNYDPTFTGNRASTTKKYRTLKPGSTSEYAYYNVALPAYSSAAQGTIYCYSATAQFDNGSESHTAGPWDKYDCYGTKVGTSDLGPTSSAGGNGYSNLIFSPTLTPTDSDKAQGIYDFGARVMQYDVGRTWFSNESPGRGYLYVPIKSVDATQAATLNAALDCNIPPDSTGAIASPCTAAGIKNAGLTPIEGTLLTAKDYFGESWTDTSEGYTSSTYPLPSTCGSKYVILLTDGLPSTDKDGKIVTDSATALTAAAAAAAQLKSAGVTTYVVGFAMPYGTDPAALDTIAASGGTTKAYSATDQATLNAAMQAIFAKIAAATASSGATTANSTALSTDTLVFKASFNTSDWSGALKGYPVDSTTGVSSTATWTATIPAAGSRKIYTWDGSAAKEFKWATIPSSQQSKLGSSEVVEYLRGDPTGEGTTYRKRSSLLGDIVDSAPVYIKEYSGGTSTTPAMSIVAVGANDGMLHIFDGTSGVELYAYVPAGIDFDNLKAFTATTYTGTAHRYFVDGQIAISSRSDLSGGKNILVGTLGRGGRGAFALDVTDPTNISVLWDQTGASAQSGLGYVLGTPVIGQISNGLTGNNAGLTDVVMLPGGITKPGDSYSGQDQASLFVLSATTGSPWYTSYTSGIQASDSSDSAVGSTASNALMNIRGWDVEGDDAIDYVYGGDLRGNLWRFDLTDSSPSVTQVFVAKDSAGKRQPITGGISVSLNPSDYKTWVHFGTGRFLTSSDLDDKTSVQSIYGILDPLDTSTIARSSLKQRTIASSSLVDGKTLRFLDTYGSLASTYKGWYIDLTDPSAGAQGERVVGTPQEVATELRVTSGIPGSGLCTPVNGGFLYVLDAFTGTSTSYQTLDTNGDGTVDDTDKTGGKTTGGISLSNGLPGDATQTGDILTIGGSSDTMSSVHVKDLSSYGRISWREIIQN